MPKILVCGDIHGHIYHLFDLIREVEDRMHIRLDGVLQAGDMGVWSPMTKKVDGPTLKFARKDPGELDLMNFIGQEDRAKGIAKERKWPRIWFVRGNHEDYEYLKSVKLGPIDPFELVWHIPGGKIVDVAGSKVGGIGGAYFQGISEKKQEKPCYTQPAEVKHLLIAKDLDIVLSHDAPHDMPKPGAGSPWLLSLIEYRAPRYVFSGHFHYIGRTLRYESEKGVTEAVLLNQIHAVYGKCERFAGILDENGFEFIPKEIEDGLNGRWY